MDEEQIERIVESSKRIQSISEFTTNEDTVELLENMAVALLALTVSMKENTELDNAEVISAVIGAAASILVGFITNYDG